MFEQLSYQALQQYWWFIVSLVGALLVFLLFVQGGQTLLWTLGKTPTERSLLINTFGRKWEFTFTTLVTFGGVFFASFPLFYSCSFGGAYWIWMIILFAFVIQAVSYQFRSKPKNTLGQKTYDGMLFFNGVVSSLLLGVVVSTFFMGANFSTNTMNYVTWDSPFHGLEAILDWRNLCLGLSVFFLARLLGLQYIMNSIKHEVLMSRAKKETLYNTIPFLIFFVTYVIVLLLKDGYSYNKMGDISLEHFKYLHNFIAMPFITILFILGIILVLTGTLKAILKANSLSIWFSGIGTILTVLSLLLIAGYNHTAFYPSLTSPQSSLTIVNACSSRFTLITMGYASLFVPIVMAYIFYTWRLINNEKISEFELKDTDHTPY